MMNVGLISRLQPQDSLPRFLLIWSQSQVKSNLSTITSVEHNGSFERGRFSRVCRRGDIWKASTFPLRWSRNYFLFWVRLGGLNFDLLPLCTGLVGSMDLLASSRVHTRGDWVRTCILYLLIPLTHISRRIMKLAYLPHFFSSDCCTPPKDSITIPNLRAGSNYGQTLRGEAFEPMKM